MFEGERSASGREWLRVSDRGQGLSMPPADAVKLFEPFERRLEISPGQIGLSLSEDRG